MILRFNKFFRVFINYVLLSFFYNSYSNNLIKEKLNLIYTEHNKKVCKILDMATINEPDNLNCGFFISFDPSVKYQIEDAIQMPILQRASGMLMRLPYISPYGYMPPSPFFKEGLGLILLTPEMLDKVIPFEIRTAISQKLNLTNPNELISELKKRNTFVNAIILGNRLKRGQQVVNGPSSGIYNMRYHFWVALSRNLAQAQTPYDPNSFHMFKFPDFNIPIDMGLFLPRGLVSLAENPADTISLNQLKEQNVYWHNALSPNNARFKIDMNKQLSSFWSVAISENNQHVNITYFLIANTDKISNLLKNILASSNNLEQLKVYLSTFKMKYPWVSDEDFQTLSTWVNTIVNAVSETPVPSVIQPIIQPAKPQVLLPKISLENAKNLLVNLSAALNSLSSKY